MAGGLGEVHHVVLHDYLGLVVVGELLPRLPPLHEQLERVVFLSSSKHLENWVILRMNKQGENGDGRGNDGRSRECRS